VKPWIKSLSRHGAEALGITLILLGVYAYQSRNLLPAEIQPAPALAVPTLGGTFYDLREHAAPATLVYFFAPWCHICAASASNISHLRNELRIVMVALDWQTPTEVQEYADHHEIAVPVLLGDTSVARDWNIYAFPTYYVLDGQNRVIHRDLGYSTFAGLWWRSMIFD
jgi:peroxiredoxin